MAPILQSGVEQARHRALMHETVQSCAAMALTPAARRLARSCKTPTRHLPVTAADKVLGRALEAGRPSTCYTTKHDALEYSVADLVMPCATGEEIQKQTDS